jgi:hypothetical protein
MIYNDVVNIHIKINIDYYCIIIDLKLYYIYTYLL